MSYTPFLLLLCSLGTAIIVQAQDCSYPVGGENMGLSDKDINSKTFPDGSTVTFICNLGHRPQTEHSGRIVCTAGSWSPVQLICEKKPCGIAGNVENGYIDYPTGTSFGDKAVITCNPGYILVGKKTLTCGDQGWLDRLPECEIVFCDEPPNVPNAQYDPIKDSYEYEEVVQYSCNGDLVMDGSSSLTCEDDGTFKPNPPVCVSVQCDEHKVEFAEWVGGARFPYKYRDTVVLKCLPGYVMTGSPTISCGINSEWTPKRPVCTRRVPTQSTTKATTTTTTDTPVTKGPGNGGNLPAVLGAVFGVIGVASLTALGCYCFGVPELLKKKRGTRRARATKDNADVALSEPFSC
ncbi:membrane cofactor protein-like isoform X1 [Gouania willdenowi]|nr:membrane cofactor protein-like isoform X1 [Gouania willdenowi]